MKTQIITTGRAGGLRKPPWGIFQAEPIGSAKNPSAAHLSRAAFGEGNRLFTEFKGALTENFVLQTLVTQFEVVPRYWSQDNPPYCY
ncbi:hypothetical protein [uncultured Pyramidobacter sp.]|uniref:hypothetical protein n=1 Tax=uncultured Pyramidobacter sp. TaxID=1623495 RepID=UPI000A000428|nr:hypothetical protein [uncultured Pyramidobacter sp.]